MHSDAVPDPNRLLDVFVVCSVVVVVIVVVVLYDLDIKTESVEQQPES